MAARARIAASWSGESLRRRGVWYAARFDRPLTRRGGSGPGRAQRGRRRYPQYAPPAPARIASGRDSLHHGPVGAARPAGSALVAEPAMGDRGDAAATGGAAQAAPAGGTAR